MNVFELLRDQVPIENVVGRYSEVRGSKVHCVAPDHQDLDPSMHLYGDHTYCFSCGFHGDVTDIYATVHGLDRPIEAALDLAREYAIQLPKQDPEAQKRTQECREKEDLYLRQAQACHRALGRHPKVGEWWKGRGFGEEFQGRFLLGANKSGTEAVIPYWNRGRVQGLIRRRLAGKPKYTYPEVTDFPKGFRPLFIASSVRAGAFLVEGIVDALAVAALGESAIGVGGTGISEHQLRELERLPGPFYVLPDADEEGAAAARQWVRHLYPKALLCPAEYGREASRA